MLDPGKTEIGKTEPNLGGGRCGGMPTTPEPVLTIPLNSRRAVLSQSCLPRRRWDLRRGKRTTRAPQWRYAKYEKPAAKHPTSYDPILMTGPEKGRLNTHQGHGWLLRVGAPAEGGQTGCERLLWGSMWLVEHGVAATAAQLHTHALENHVAVHLHWVSSRGWTLPS